MTNPNPATSDPANTPGGPPSQPQRRPTSSAWRILGRALAPRGSRAQVTAAILCAALGFAAVTQVRHTAQADYSGLRESELVELLDQLTRRGNDLSAQNSALEDQLAELESTRGQAVDAERASQERQRIQGVLAGTLPADGPGVILRVYDPAGRVTPSSLYHVIEELRNAGAEAMSLGDIRITASTWVADSYQGGTRVIKVNGQAVTPPYEFRAIGDPATIEVALGVPGGALASIRNEGGTSDLSRQAALNVTAVAPAPTFEFASPVPES